VQPLVLGYKNKKHSPSSRTTWVGRDSAENVSLCSSGFVH
jgi:hypothetical protein